MTISSSTIGLKPRHVAVIMDGNGRWAKERGLPRIQGHKKGVNTASEIVEASIEAGIEYLTLYAFSLENWKRPRTEIKSLMSILKGFLKENLSKLDEKNIRFIPIGSLENLTKGIQKLLISAKEKTAGNTGLNLVLALSYGSRTEIVDGVKSFVKDVMNNETKLDDLNEKTFSKYLYTKDVPDPDMVIRTSGEMRLSNFLLYQASYAEIWVTDVYWPDFHKEIFFKALDDYASRSRRYGGL
ncbi:MAG: isoprenyl transferase [Candidatus Theseobacter exili]|nr:isoprenyl transferase [Candidatus Theseobacter exili]